MQKEQRRMRPEREAAEGYMRIRKAYIRTLTALLALVAWLWPIQTEAVQAPGEEAPAPLELRARAAVLMDGDTGRILYGKNQDQTLPMASTTKIMTCILALENASLDDVVEVSSYAASMPDVQLNIREGEQYRLGDLLYSLMLESHNDTAAAIAEHVAGTREAFADMMNQKARDIGCRDTFFITPNGLDAEDPDTGRIHSTTAAELAGILRYCLFQSPEREGFLQVTRAPSHAFSDVSGTRTFSCVNHNALLTTTKGAISGKTGFTAGAGYCYVGAVKKGEKTFIAALLGCGWPPHRTYKWEDMGRLLAFGDENYDFYELLKETPEIPPIPVKNRKPDRAYSGISGAGLPENTDEPERAGDHKKEGGKGAYGPGGSRNGGGPGGLLRGGRSGGQLSCDSLRDGGKMGSGILCENPFKWIFILL